MAIKKGKKDTGLFIVIEGGEGAGSTTVAKKVVEALGWSAIYTREPGGSPYAEKIRELVLSDYAKHSDAETQFALFWAARRDHVMKTIKPAIEGGKIVVCDRFDSSTYAYQIVAQDEKQLEPLFWSMREHMLDELQPDAYILLDVPPETGLARAKERGESTLNHFDKRKVEFHEKVNKGLRDFVKKVDGVIIDATQPLDKVLADTLAVVKEL